MKKNLLCSALALTSLFAGAQNVGIGTLTPTEAKLQVEMAGTGTKALFTDGTSGISMITELSRPGVGFNMVHKGGGYKFSGNGFGSLFYYLPASGRLTYYSSTAAGTSGASVLFSDVLTLQADGNVGIGATSPTEAKLQIHEPAGNTQFLAAAGNNLPGVSTFVPVSAPSVGFNVRYQNGYKFMGAGYGGFFQFSPTLGRLYYYYSSTKGLADGSVSSVFALAIDSSGQLGIGTSVPKAPLHVTGNVVFGSSSINPATGYRLSVDGKIICEELKVQLNTSWPDYVFEKDYQMPSLLNLEKKVMEEKHLPGIPSALDIKAQQGIEMGDMQKRLLEKIEELYRYTFELNQKNLSLEKKIASLEQELKKDQD